jgi:hypothetical protein
MSGKDKRPLPSYGVVVFPSLHWHVADTVRSDEDREKPKPKDQEERFDLGESTFEKILPGDLKRGDVVMIAGERGTFKTAIAQDFLAKGLSRGESVLLISLANRPQLLERPGDPPKARMISHELALTRCEHRKGLPETAEEAEKRFYWKYLQAVEENDREKMVPVSRKTKGQIWAWHNVYTTRTRNFPRLVEVNFRSGMLLPEEFVQIVRSLLEHGSRKKGETDIRRVVFDDVSLIGLSYPFLRESSTTGTLFLSAFVDLMRNYGVDLVMTGTTGDLPEANEAVHRATALADAVVSCQYCNVFGDRYVTVRGQGLMRPSVRRESVGAESVPAVIHWLPKGTDDVEEQETFALDLDLLEGLVGFDSGPIHRPGILAYLFSQYKEDPKGGYTDKARWQAGTAPDEKREQGQDDHPEQDQDDEEAMETADSAAATNTDKGQPDTAVPRLRVGVHERYNASLQTLIESAFGRQAAAPAPRDGGGTFAPEVSVVGFDSTESEAVHDSLRLLRSGQPVDHTVLYSLDEFWETEEHLGDFLTTGRDELRGDVTRNSKSEVPSDEPRDHIVLWSRPDCVRPYYANVLLLAYRVDVDRRLKRERVAFSSWRQVERLAKRIERVWKKRGVVGGKTDPCATFGERAFWFDQSAQETLACAMMDALIAGYDARKRHVIAKSYKSYRQAAGRGGRLGGIGSKRVKLSGLLREAIAPHRPGQPTSLMDTQTSQLKALTHLFHMMKPEDRWRRRLRPDACVYLCWYSQLRDLIDEYPQLAGRLKVAPLPAGGFTGDWFVGIHKGSVSIGLGREVLNILCNRSEQYKRFAMGVGLPTLKDFYGRSRKTGPDFFAWPGGNRVKATEMRDIHAGALSRSLIEGYQTFRAALATVAFQLTPFSGYDKSDLEDHIRRTVGRLGAQAALLRDSQ